MLFYFILQRHNVSGFRVAGCATYLNMTNSSSKYVSSTQKYAKAKKVAKNILIEGGNVTLDTSQAFLLPSWYDEQKFRRGQQYFSSNLFAMLVAKLSGLLVVLAVPSILRVLVSTGQSSHPMSAFRRYLDTISHMLQWYDGDLANPNSRASKSLLSIRGRHCYANRKASHSGFGGISQKDMALTQFGFMGFVLLRAEELGVAGSPQDVEGFIHFWRVIGYLLGIKDKYNLCQEDVESTRAACELVLEQVFVPGLQKPSPQFPAMSRALLDGMWALNPTINYDAFLAFTQILCGMDVMKLTTFYSRLLLNLQVFVHRVVLNSMFAAIIRPVLNFNLWLAIVIAERFPYLAFLAFGRSIAAPEQFTIRSTLISEQ